MSEAPGHEMPFLDHLEELRKRLFWVAGAIIIGVVLAFVLLSKLDIIRLLERPILPLLNGQKLIYTHPGTSFHILLNASLVLGIILASPVVVGQLWGFLLLEGVWAIVSAVGLWKATRPQKSPDEPACPIRTGE